MQVRIQDLDWSITLEKLTRRQVVAMAKLGEFIGNIEKLVKAEFPTPEKEIGESGWSEIRDAFRVFGRARSADKEFFARMVQVHKDVLEDIEPQ